MKVSYTPDCPTEHFPLLHQRALHPMNFQKLSWFPILSFLPFTTQFLILQFPVSLSNPDALFYHTCGSTFNCFGSITGIGFTLSVDTENHNTAAIWGLDLNCQDNNPTIYITNMKYRILGFNQATQTMKIAR